MGKTENLYRIFFKQEMRILLLFSSEDNTKQNYRNWFATNNKYRYKEGSNELEKMPIFFILIFCPPVQNFFQARNANFVVVFI